MCTGQNPPCWCLQPRNTSRWKRLQPQVTALENHPTTEKETKRIPPLDSLVGEKISPPFLFSVCAEFGFCFAWFSLVLSWKWCRIRRKYYQPISLFWMMGFDYYNWIIDCFEWLIWMTSRFGVVSFSLKNRSFKELVNIYCLAVDELFI